MKNYKLLPKIALWSLIIIGVAVSLMFFIGGDSQEGHEVAGKTLPIPMFSDIFLYWIYCLLGLALLVTLCAVGKSFVHTWKYERRKAYTLICVLVGFVALFVVCWFLGSPKEVVIPGYDGTDNVGFWAQLTDMVLYACYFLVAATFLTLIIGRIYTSRKK